jgi:hypothetical protein
MHRLFYNQIVIVIAHTIVMSIILLLIVIVHAHGFVLVGK